MKAVFMYHAVGDDDDIIGADPHYAVSEAAFVTHLQVIQPRRSLAQVIEGARLDTHILTFDDGHISNYVRAFPHLEAGQWCAEFYLNTAMVGKPGFVTWDHVREMHAAGLSMQSHADEHVYLSELQPDDIRQQLDRSKKRLEDALGAEVTVLAPPGGRYDARVEQIAWDVGYHAMAVSRPGHMASPNQRIVPRYAVLHNTSSEQVTQLLDVRSKAARRQVAKYRITGLAKRLLGNQRYEKVRERLLGASHD